MIKYIFLILLMVLASCFSNKTNVENIALDATTDEFFQSEESNNAVVEQVDNKEQVDNNVQNNNTAITETPPAEEKPFLINDFEGSPEAATTSTFKNNAKAPIIAVNRDELEYVDYDQYLRITEAENNIPQDSEYVNLSFVKKLFYLDSNLEIVQADTINIFKANNLFIFNDVPILILQIENSETLLENKQRENPALKYIPSNYKYSSSIKVPELSELHTVLLNQFAKKTFGNEKILLIIYMHPNNHTAWTKKDVFKESRMIYTQTLSTFLYSNIKNVRIEFRYSDHIPTNEIILTAFGYEGTLPFTVYSVTKTKGVDWLRIVLQIQQDLRLKQNEARRNVQKAISSLGQ